MDVCMHAWMAWWLAGWLAGWMDGCMHGCMGTVLKIMASQQLLTVTTEFVAAEKLC